MAVLFGNCGIIYYKRGVMGDLINQTDLAKNLINRAADVSGISPKSLSDKNAMKYGYRYNLMGAIEIVIDELANKIMDLQKHNQELERRLWEKENGHYNK